MAKKREHRIQSRGPNGRPLCPECGKEIPKGRRVYCSGECSDLYSARFSGSWARSMVAKRDKGVCGACGLDTVAVGSELSRMERGLDGKWLPYRDRDLVRSTWDRFKGELRIPSNGHLWEMDHVQPVVEGGGQCGLDNLRTLCIWCHRKETAELARRRVARRKCMGTTDRELDQLKLGLEVT